MAQETFQLTTVTRILADDVELADALGFPEISALGDTERRWQAGLQAKAKTLLQDGSTMSLYRRQAAAQPELLEVEIRMAPPKHAPDWREPVLLRLTAVVWEEAGDLHQAYVPALGILVFAPRKTLLAERIQEHVRLVLMGRKKRLGLRDLAQLAQAQQLKLGQLEVAAKIPSPKERAAGQKPAGEKPSTLASLAEELPPFPARPGGSSPTGKPKAAPAPAAFEVEAELKKLAELLSGPQRRSVLLVGGAGSGKTALVHELARRRQELGFGETAFWSTSGARLMTGPVGFGMWQERCQKMCQEAAATRAVLHLGNLAELLEVGKARSGQQSVGGFLRPAIARGEVLAIAECTPEQISALERHEPHLLDAFLQFPVPERTREQTRRILDQVWETAPGKRDENHIAGTQAALDRLHQLHLRYAIYSANPGRVIRFLKGLLSDRLPDKALTEAEVTAAFSRETGLPAVLLDDRLPLDLAQTRDWFSQRIIGQPEAVTRVVDLLTVIKARLARPGKPLASFLFIGPTGTGKTETAKALAEFLFGDAARLARFDLNQFNDPLSLQRLMGGPLAGGREGLLTARIREQPFSVVLLDEFEKADPGFYDLLLQILGDGRLTDASGRVADFCNSVIVITSNLGAEGFQQGPAGFQADGSPTRNAREHFTEAVRKFLRPEIFNRLDAIVPFLPLPPETVQEIARRQMSRLGQRDGFRLRPVELTLPPAVAMHLAQKGYDVRYGARPLKRAIERELLVPLAEAMAQYDGRLPLTAQIAVTEARLDIEVKPALPPGEGQPDLPQLLPANIVTQRRLIARLKKCSLVQGLDNQVVMIESQERRLAKVKWRSPDQQARLQRLPKLRECLAGIAALYDRARQIETDVLLAAYQRQPLNDTLILESSALHTERERWQREAFRLHHEEPDDIVLAVFGEHQATLLELAQAYHTLAGQNGRLMAFDYFFIPPGERVVPPPQRKPAPQLTRPFEKLPDKVIGFVMHLRGNLFFPWLVGEGGLHGFKDNKTEHVCLVETRRLPFNKYQPPAGIERHGNIKGRNAPLCREFKPEKKIVQDSILGERPWFGVALPNCLGGLLHERLGRFIQAVTEQ